MNQAVKAGFLYFAVLFALGWVLGPIRVLLLEPRLGQAGALAIEAPLMIAGMVFAARWLTARLGIAHACLPRATMGLTAVASLAVAEILSSILISGQPELPSTSDVSWLFSLAGALSIGLYCALATMPLIVGRR
ncbi:MAG: hypothetical protein AAFV45_13035 [Pseudomonadota bacterium]